VWCRHASTDPCRGGIGVKDVASTVRSHQTTNPMVSARVRVLQVPWWRDHHKANTHRRCVFVVVGVVVVVKVLQVVRHLSGMKTGLLVVQRLLVAMLTPPVLLLWPPWLRQGMLMLLMCLRMRMRMLRPPVLLALALMQRSGVRALKCLEETQREGHAFCLLLNHVAH